MIGTVLAGLAQWKGTASGDAAAADSGRASKRRKTKAGQDTADESKTAAAAAPPLDYDPAVTSQYMFFVYNNPDDVLLPFTRSRTVIEVGTS